MSFFNKKINRIASDRFPAAVLLATLFLLAVYTAAPAAETRWTEDFESGIRKARSQGRHALVNFYSDNCRWCDRMFEHTYTDSRVARYLNENFITIKVNGENEKDLKADFTVIGYPTIWFVDEKGEKVGFMPGYFPAEDFLPALKYINTRSYDEMTYEEFLDREEE